MQASDRRVNNRRRALEGFRGVCEPDDVLTGIDAECGIAQLLSQDITVNPQTETVELARLPQPHSDQAARSRM